MKCSESYFDWPAAVVKQGGGLRETEIASYWAKKVDDFAEVTSIAENRSMKERNE